MKGYYKTVSLSFLCGMFGKSRQAYYDYSNRREREKFEDSIIIDLVKKERGVAKRVGSKRLYLILKPDLVQHGIKIGRDLFHEVLRINGFLIKKRRNRQKTTNSRHSLPKYPNISKEIAVTKSEQLWVSDITYVRVGNGFCYLILITDAYSRKVVGYNFSTTMNAAFCMQALEVAIANRQFSSRLLTHHSDRGLQYCSAVYVEMLTSNGIKISMTENGDPLENALAERMNGIFKDNFDIGQVFSDFETADICIDQAINYYNHRLPHSSCDMKTPAQAHLLEGVLKKHWK
jgi:putative transposase